MARDYYEVLGVSKTATPDEIRKAYRKLAREHHPDVNPDRRDEAEAQFKEIGEAYNALSDEQKRARYDRFGPEGVSGGGGPDISGAGGLGDLFDVFFGGAGGGAGRAREDIRRGSDIRADVTLTLEECWAGVTKELRIPTLRTCGTCSGSGAAPGTQPENCVQCSGSGRVREVRNTFFGQFVQEAPCPRCAGRGKIIPNPCPTCRGDGRVRGERNVSIAIPMGVDEGDRVRVTGSGEDGQAGSPPGDLYCFISVEESRDFQRRENDVLHVMTLSYAQAALGDTVEVPTLEMNGDKHVEASINVPAGTQNGALFRVSGKGFTSRGGYRGDQVCVTRVVVPKKLNDRQKELLREFAEIENEHLEEQPRGFFDKLKDAFGLD
ncbi:molecular chaperone DnaJ [bacterium]|nr:MAG: molecular chaperone DnaJ [bacterium]